MDKIATNKRTREIVGENNFTVKKNFGQNFLIDQHVINKIVTSSDIYNNEMVIEIGPGIGGLTEELLEKAGLVVAIEIDKTLIPILEKNFKDYKNFVLINEDVLKLNLDDIIKEHGYESAKVIANLPYYITTPIIMDLLEHSKRVTDIIVMIQKEVAQRFNAVKNTKEYGALTLIVNFYAETEIVANVPQNCFLPRPQVDSCVIKISKRDKVLFDIENTDLLFKLVKAGFAMRRKTLVNCLFSFFEKKYSKEELENLLVDIGLDKRIRGESLELCDFVRLLEKVE